MMQYVRGAKVMIREIPWKGVHGTYIGPTRVLWLKAHMVEVGDLVSGGTPRWVKVRKIVPLEGD